MDLIGGSVRFRILSSSCLVQRSSRLTEKHCILSAHLGSSEIIITFGYPFSWSGCLFPIRMFCCFASVPGNFVKPSICSLVLQATQSFSLPDHLLLPLPWSSVCSPCPTGVPQALPFSQDMGKSQSYSFLSLHSQGHLAQSL